MTGPIIVIDSITHAAAEGRGRVVVTGSHGGSVAAAMAAAAGVGAVIFNDAGVGREGAGVAGLALLQALGTPAAAVSHDSARIGDGSDMMARGRISHANALARDRGVEVGQACTTAAGWLNAGALTPGRVPAEALEQRVLAQEGPPQVWLLDSASMAGPQDVGAIVVTGSHGGLLGGRPETAIKADVLAVFYNDAGIGVDRAGVSRLAALQPRGIPAATVSAHGARIGDARSTYEDGVISACNPLAAALGISVGAGVRDAVRAIANHVRT